MKPIADPRYSHASTAPQTSRTLLHYAAKRGVDPARLCLGLGFSPDDLKTPDYRLSCRQSYLLVGRAQKALGEDGLGLSVGSTQTAVSWGLVGMGMLASATLGQALQLFLRFQRHSGSLLDYEVSRAGTRTLIIASTRFFDPEVELFYLEEAFASGVSIVRHLTQQPHNPQSIELQFPRPAHWQRYEALFQCPVIFSAERNLMSFEASLLQAPLPTQDEYTEAEIYQLLDTSSWLDQSTSDLIESVQREVQNNLIDPPQLSELATLLNLGERTLRRRLTEAGLSYYGIVDSLRRTKALALLSHGEAKLIDVALETGFSDVRNFRRAFKRWTGIAPREAKKPQGSG